MSSGAAPPPAAPWLASTHRRAGIAFAAAAVIAAGAVVPPWLGWAPALVAFSMTGTTLLWVLDPDGGAEVVGDTPVPAPSVRTAVLSVMLSTAIVILAAVALDVVTIRIDRASLALSLAGIEALLGAASLARAEPAGALDVRLTSRLVTGVVVVVGGAATLVAAIVGVHAMAPASPTAPYARISWAGSSAPNGIESVRQGPAVISVSVQAIGAAGSFELSDFLDGEEMAPPVTVDLHPGVPVDAVLRGSYPSLDGCLHRVQVTLSGPGGGADLSVTRYVRGAGAGGCRGSS